MSFFVGYKVLSWTGPTGTAPASNAPAPINVSSAAQTKTGTLTLGTLNAAIIYDANDVGYYVNPSGQSVFSGSVGIGTTDPGTNKLFISGGNLKVGGSIIDSAGNTFYNDSTKKVERTRLPFEQGDITSDVDTNTWDVAYYNVANLTPGNVKSAIAFGRSETGTLAPAGTAAVTDCKTATTFYSGDSWTQKTGSAGCVQASAPSGSIIKIGQSICGVSGTYSGHDWVQCAYFVDTDGDDIGVSWDDGCNGHANYRFVCKQYNNTWGSDITLTAAQGYNFSATYFTTTYGTVGCNSDVACAPRAVRSSLTPGMVDIQLNVWSVNSEAAAAGEGSLCGSAQNTFAGDWYKIYYAD